MSLFILTAEWGDGIDFSHEVRGVFSTFKLALDAISDMPRISDETYKAHRAFRARQSRWLVEHGKIQADYAPGLVFPDGHTVYRKEDYKHAEEAAQPEPTFWYHDNDVIYRILEVSLDANHPDFGPHEVWSNESEN